MSKTWRTIGSVSVVRFYALAVSTLILLITARALGPSLQGILVTSIAWTGLLANLATLSIEQVAHYRVQLRTDSNWQPKICGTVLFLCALLSTIGVVAGFCLQHVTAATLFRNIPPGVLSMAFALLPLMMFEQSLSSLLTAAARLNCYNRAQVAGRTLWLLLTIAFVVMWDLNVYLALAAQICGQLLMVLLSGIGLLKGSFRELRIDFSEAKELLKGATRLHPNSIGAFILNQSGVLTLNHFSSSSDVAWFQVANQMVIAFLVIPYAASSFFYSTIAQSNPDRIWPEQKAIMLYVMTALLIMTGIAFLAAPWVIPFLLGDQYAPAVRAFRWLIPSVFGLAFAQMMAPQWISRGKFTWTTAATVIAAVINLVANLILIPRLHLMGAVWVALATYLGAAVLCQAAFALWCERQSRRMYPQPQDI